MKILEADILNLEKLTKLFDAYRVFYKKDSDLSEAESFLKERIENNESTIYVAEEDGNLIGFTQLFPLFSSTRMKRLWLLNDLYVDEKHRGRGISKLLIARAMQLAADTNSCGLILETAKDNLQANTLYIATGWDLDSEHNYYIWENKV